MRRVNPKIYKRKSWQMLRESILRRDDYLCRQCKRTGKRTEATEVHHIYSVEARPDLMYNPDNLISLCMTCHNLMHDREAHTMTRLGQHWQRKIKNKIPGPPGVKK